MVKNFCLGRKFGATEQDRLQKKGKKDREKRLRQATAERLRRVLRKGIDSHIPPPRPQASSAIAQAF